MQSKNVKSSDWHKELYTVHQVFNVSKGSVPTMKSIGVSLQFGTIKLDRLVDLASFGRTIFILILLCYFIMVAAQTPPPSPPALGSVEFEDILSSLRTAGLTSSASVLQTAVSSGDFSLPASDFTIFAPTNTALNNVLLSYPELNAVLSYHIATEYLPYDMLVSISTGTQIPTLLSGSTLLVTDSVPSNFLIDEEQVLIADLCNVPTIACHAVNGIFNSSVWGQAVIATAPVGALSPVGAPYSGPLPPLGSPVVPPFGSPLTAPVGSPELSPGDGGLSPSGSPGSPRGILPPPSGGDGPRPAPSTMPANCGYQVLIYYSAAQSVAVAAAAAVIVSTIL